MIDENSTLSRFFFTCHQLDDSRFAGTALSDNKYKFTVLDFETNSPQGIRSRFVGLAYIVKSNQTYFPLVRLLPLTCRHASALILLFEIGPHHGSQLEKDGIIETAKIQAGNLLYFIETVDERIAMHKEASRSLASV